MKMLSTSDSTNSALLAVILVAQTRSGSGAQIIFHYPARPLQHPKAGLNNNLAEPDESSSSDSGSSSSSDDNALEINNQDVRAPAGHLHEGRPTDSGSEADKDRRAPDTRSGTAPSEPLLGIGEEGLISLLAPGRVWHKRRFEMGINDLTFLGRPVYSRSSGRCTRRRRKNARNGQSVATDPTIESTVGTDTETEGDNDDHTQPAQEDGSELAEGDKSALTMFNTVFVMNPRPFDKAQMVDEMYDNIVRKFSKILKEEQTKTNYVSKQVENIQTVRASRPQAYTALLWNELQKQSSLASAIATIYKAVSTGRIASFSLGPRTSFSLQIPPITSVEYLPSMTERPIQPGLWMTTVNSSSSRQSDLDTVAPSSRLHMAKSFTLLLTENVHRVTKDIQAAGGPLSLPLVGFVEKARPTKSFYKLALATQTSLADIQLYSQSLLYWRRAIIVPPLHHRDTYIVSPNADMTKLIPASTAFEKTFPMMPALPRFLNLLSQTPTPFGTLIPSMDHKEEYYRVLAWLLQGGWVTQLRTFAYVRVSTRTKSAVRTFESETKRPHADRNIENNNPATPHNEHTRPTPPHKRPSIISRPSSDSSHPSANGAPTQHSSKTSSFIPSPLRASAIESQWLAHIADSFTSFPSSHNPNPSSQLSSEERIELKRHWLSFVKYFNGTESLESIPIREGLKRKFVWSLFGKMGLNFDRGVQDSRGENEAVLVTVRHW